MSIWQPQAESRSDQGIIFGKQSPGALVVRCIVYWVQASRSNPFLFFHLFYRFLNFGHFSPFAYSIFDGTLPKWSFVPTFFFPLLILSFIFVFIFFCFMFAFLSMSFLVFMFHLDFNYFSRFHFFIWIFIIYLLLVFFWMLATCPHFPVLVPVIRFHFFLLYSAGLCHHDGQAAAQMTGYSEWKTHAQGG